MHFIIFVLVLTFSLLWIKGFVIREIFKGIFFIVKTVFFLSYNVAKSQKENYEIPC